jgi:hypothetical protein
MIKIHVKIENDKLILTSDKKFSSIVYKEFDVDSDSKMEAIDDKFVYTIPDLSYNRLIMKKNLCWVYQMNFIQQPN